MSRRTRRTLAGLLATTLLAAIITACGDGSVGDSDSASDDDAARTTLPAKPCPGEPLKFTAIAALSGTAAANADRFTIGNDAAVNAINRECTLGRPLEVILCDDKADANANLACGREAASNGSLAILGTIGSFDDGVTASKLPAIFVNGTSPFELTNEDAYSSLSGISLGMSGVSAVKAKGLKNSSLVLPDTPTLQFAGKLLQDVAAVLDLEVKPIYFPSDTTDFAPVAAQINALDTEAVGLLPSNPVVMINALAAEGLTPAETPMVVPSAVITPEVVDELGPALNGMIVVSQTAPPTDTENPGIAEFRAELEANGQDPDDEDVTITTVGAWSNIKKLEGALLAASPEVRASLDTKKLIDTIVKYPADRPEAAPYDFSKNALPELPSLAGFRIFTREVAILQIQDGKYNNLSNGFIDILEPPDIE
jgi:ABC-type branched-subunit amino acid transport system substrate-binding protein